MFLKPVGGNNSMTQRIRAQLAMERSLWTTMPLLALLLGTGVVASAQGQQETPERKIVIDEW